MYIHECFIQPLNTVALSAKNKNNNTDFCFCPREKILRNILYKTHPSIWE